MTIAVPPGRWRSRIVGSGEEDPTQLLAHPQNWRHHPAPQRRALVGSLAEVGWVQQVMVNQRTGHVVDGHARVEEAISQGEPQVPVLYVDLSEEEEAIVLATLDPIAAMAVPDEARLLELLADISVDDQGLAELLNAMAPRQPKAGLTDADAVPEVKDTMGITRGALFALGNHRLLCGDATDAADVERVLGTRKPALIATDPPYGVDYATIAGPRGGRKNVKAEPWADIEGDGNGPDAADLLRRSLVAVRPLVAEGCAVLIWHPAGPNARLFHDAVGDAGLHIFRQIIWMKPHLVFGRHEYHWRHENALYGWFEGSRARFVGDRSETTVWEVDYGPGVKSRGGPSQRAGLGYHPTQKPVELTSIPLRNHTLPGDTVYEPFAGSGSAIIAAEQMDRVCAAIDIDPTYVATCLKRWELFSGQKAERLDG